MFQVYFSNRFETLSHLLLQQLSGTRADVFASDQVVVPSTAMRRTLTLALADQEAVCANVDFFYLARWLWQQVARVAPQVGAESPFDPGFLAWRVFAAFGDEEFVHAHRRLANYLNAPGADAVMRYELAAGTAALLEQYVTYRPDWLAQWQHKRSAASLQGEAMPATVALDEAWQAALWRRISGDLGVAAAHPMESMANELQRGGPALARSCGLPARVHVFALSAVPPLHLGAMQSLSRWMDVHLYVLNPCRDYWFQFVDPKQLSRLEAAGQEQGHETGHRLLASWGKQTQSSVALLMDVCNGEGGQSFDHSEEGSPSTLLGRLQNSILDAKELEPASVQLAAGDRSVEVHVCHSITRELEVLQDYLLGLFAADTHLQPSDVLVVTPDVEAAAPLIEAVFGTVPAARRIPFAITGRARSSANAPVRAFVELLALAASRCTATGVFGLLQQPIVARRFGLDETDLQQVHAWMLAAGINWALDGDHVAAVELPNQVSHTFADGLERLFLGYALPDHVPEPFGAVLPCGRPEGSSAAALGAFWQFIEGLRELRGWLAQPRAAADWVDRMHAAADRFLSPADSEIEDQQELHAVLDELGEAMARGGLDEPVPAPVLRRALERALDDPARGGVPTGRVTLASMSSLRNLPFKVVCAIGLNDGAFPSADRPFEFDLMAHAPRLGDRQRRTDQRTLFLDLVLAARSSLYLGYTGRSIRDNAPLPPSVLVSELLDFLLPAIASSGQSKEALDAARARLVVEHPLQPFSAEAFAVGGDPRLRSFDAELAQSLRESLQAEPAAPAPAAQETPEEAQDDAGEDSEEEGEDPAQPFFTAPLAAPGPEWREVAVRSLVEFFGNPSRYLLRRRLGVDLPRDEEALDDDEPFLPTTPARSALANRLLPLLLEGLGIDAARRLAQAGTELPPGALGAAEMERELASLAAFAQAVLQATRGVLLPPHQAKVQMQVAGETWTVQGGFADLRSDALVRWRYDDERARDVLEGWVHHLLLSAAPAAQAQRPTKWLSRDGMRVFPAMAEQEARQHLATLVALYRRGLCEALPFFPKSAWTLVTTESSYKAAQSWNGGQWPGEKDKPGYALAFRGQGDPLAGDFEELAHAVFDGVPKQQQPLETQEHP